MYFNVFLKCELIQSICVIFSMLLVSMYEFVMIPMTIPLFFEILSIVNIKEYALRDNTHIVYLRSSLIMSLYVQNC